MSTPVYRREGKRNEERERGAATSLTPRFGMGWEDLPACCSRAEKVTRAHERTVIESNLVSIPAEIAAAIARAFAIHPRSVRFAAHGGECSPRSGKNDVMEWRAVARRRAVSRWKNAAWRQAPALRLVVTADSRVSACAD